MTGRRLAILAEDTLDFHHGKTATSLLRYRPDDVVAVIDSTHDGETTGTLLGLAGATPICRDVEAAMPYGPDTLLIGIAPRGGGLPDAWRAQILFAIEHDLDVVSGLHFMLSEDREFASAARNHGVKLVDVRQPPDDIAVVSLRPRRAGSQVVTFVGSDCAVGKMTAALEVTQAARARGFSAAFVATGQTGILLEGRGVAIDRVIGDFMSGAVEELVVNAAESADWVFVEGQGSLLHPAYSGVTLALLHGSAPDAMILVHPPGHEQIDEYPVAVPDVRRLVEVYEQAAGWIRPAKVVGLALNTRALTEDDGRRAIEEARAATGLPATDPVRFGADVLVDAITAVRYPDG